MKRLLAIAILLALGISGYASIAKAAPGTHPAVSHCVANSDALPYPSTGLDSSAPRLDGYAIPYPPADLGGDSHGCPPGNNPTMSGAVQLQPTTLLPVTRREAVELMAFPFEGLNPHGPVADTTTASVELMAFPFDGLNPGRPVANPSTASIELMAFPFEDLNPRGPVTDRPARPFHKLPLFCP